MPIISELGISLVVSTYQAGKVCVLGTRSGALELSFHNFDRAMGIAAGDDVLAVGTRGQIVQMFSAPSVAKGLQPSGSRDAAFLARRSSITGDFHVHEMAWSAGELWVVNTMFSCLSTIDEQHSFVPRWKPPFISQLAPQDRCHLNGLAIRDGLPGFVTAMSQTDTSQGWRPVKADSGIVMDVETNEVVASNLCMPHSPRLSGNTLWFLNSGKGQLCQVDLNDRRQSVVEVFPGYTRGLALHGRFAFVGLSRIRERSTFGGIPLADHRENLRCAVAAVDLQTGRAAAFFEFTAGVEEIFDVQVLPYRNPALVGPNSQLDESGDVWLVPPRLAGGMIGQATDTQTNESPSHVRSIHDPTAGSAYNQGNSLMREDRIAEAIECYQRAIVESPGFAQAHCNLGIALCHGGRPEESLHALDRALGLSPGMAIARFNRGLAKLTAGDFAGGFDDYECRWCARGQDNRPRSVLDCAPQWTGESLVDKSILVYGEQGVGDEVMFMSCLPDVCDQAAETVVACDRRLVPLFQRSFPTATVVPTEQIVHPEGLKRLGATDFVTPCGSLPRNLRRRGSDFPVSESFLQADAQAVLEWKARLSESQKLTVGISWRGGKNSEEQTRRSLPLMEWEHVLKTQDVRFVNLQYGECRQEILEVSGTYGVQIESFPEINPLLELDRFAALISALDLVISIDNSTVHLAGALGIPVWATVCNHATSSWRWLQNRDDTLWYKSVRIDRKSPDTDWQKLIDLSAMRLKERLRDV